MQLPFLIKDKFLLMKTLDEVISSYKSSTLDGRDLSRLVSFIPEERLTELDFELSPEFIGKHVHVEFTRENVLKQLQKDVALGFEKALDKRGISASLMYEVVKMWNWLLEEGLEEYDGYAQYGLPLFKATAELYGFNNPIGDDTGEEDQYKADCSY